ncbi:uncharacterized protein TRIADDRAFT_23340, partial [Trichoplax adhaerens]
QTVCLLTKRMNSYYVYRYNTSNSLHLFPPNNPIRLITMRITSNQFFDLFIFIAIFINCVLMAFPNGIDPSIEITFNTIYTVEMLLKIMARGFIFHTYAYLRDPWNWLDFIVVIVGYLTMIPALSVLPGASVIRVLRALRMITALEGLKAIVNALFKSFRMLADVFCLALFILIIFALIGVQLFMGILTQKCCRPFNSTGDIVGPFTTTKFKNYVNVSSNWYFENGDPVICGNESSARHCPADYLCYQYAYPNPNDGFTSFDNFPVSLLVSFQLITLDNWEDIYNKVNDAIDSWCIIYFIPVVLLGAFYVMNLVIAIVAMAYNKEDKILQDQVGAGVLLNANRRNGYNEENFKKLGKNIGKPEQIPKGNHIDQGSLKKKEGKINIISLKISAAIDDPAKMQPHEGNSSSTKIENTALDNPINENRKTSRSARYSALSRSDGEIDRIKPNVVSVSQSSGSATVTTVSIVLNAETTSTKSTIWRQIRVLVGRIVDDSLFELFITGCIILNTILMSMYQPLEEYNSKVPAQNIDNYVFTCIFTTEMTLKLIAFGFTGYIQSKWNVFDGIVVIISLVDLLLEFISISSNSLSVLRTLRLLRVFKLARSWTTMRRLLSTIVSGAKALLYILLILILTIYVFAVLGMKIFRDAYRKHFENLPRWNFDDFIDSFMMIFRILCGEWIEPLYDAIQATNISSILFFLAAYVVGKLLVLHLFLALLLSSFENQSFQEAYSVNSGSQKNNGNLYDALRYLIANNSVGMKAMSNISCNGGLQYSERSISQPIDCFPKVCMKRIPYCIQGETSLCQAWMTVRNHVKNVVEHRFFEGIILLLIVASSISLTFEDIHLHKNPTLIQVLYVSNIFFAAAFSIEMILKLIGIGVHGYICSPWNILDAAIVVVSIITLVLENVSAFRSLRVLRALRPLRAISHWEGMRAVVNALFGCIPHITNVIIVCAFFWLVFCVGGVNFFGGKFYKCLDLDNNLIPASIISNKTDCLANNYIWKNSQINFDSVPQAFLALFEVATFEGWIQVMGDAVDAREIDQQPIPLNNKSAYIYFVAFIIIGSFFSLNLIVSVIIDCFYALKQKSESGSLGIPTDLFMTESQKRWYNVMKTMSKSKPVRRIPLPKVIINVVNSLSTFNSIVQSNKFELAIILVIVANTAAMMVVHFDQSQEVTRILTHTLNYIFTAIYVLEAILKIIAMRQHYFKNLWNLFDFIIVLVAIIGKLFFNASIPINPSMLRTLRLFRIVRILRVLEFAKGIRKLLTAFAMSMPALFNVALLVFLVMFIYAIVGMSSFAYVKHQTAITKNMNFETFPNGLLLLFRLSTSAGWNDVLHDLMVQPPDCNNSATAFSWNGDCGNPPVAITFLITYIFITTFVLINMYVAIILNNYQEVEEEEEGSVITAEDINVFYETWAKYDPEASQFISFRYLSPLVAELKPPLRIPQPNKYPLIALDLALYDSRLVHCLDVLEALVERVIGQPNADEAGDVVEEIKRQIQKKFSETFPSSGIPKQYDKSKRLKQLAVQEIKAAVIIQRAYRHYRLRKACKEHCQRMRRQSVIHL